jgi:hypothetical protein
VAKVIQKMPTPSSLATGLVSAVIPISEPMMLELTVDAFKVLKDGAGDTGCQRYRFGLGWEVPRMGIWTVDIGRGPSVTQNR